MIDYEDIALKYARQHGYDSIQKAGEKDGDRIFRYFRKDDPRYVGIHFIRIANDGSYKMIEAWTTDWYWAINQLKILD